MVGCDRNMPVIVATNAGTSARKVRLHGQPSEAGRGKQCSAEGYRKEGERSWQELPEVRSDLPKPRVRLKANRPITVHSVAKWRDAKNFFQFRYGQIR